MARRGRASRRGFTLVELLVVVGLIAIFAAGLAVVATRTGPRGRAHVCMHHMRQVLTALAVYQQDYGDLPLDHAGSCDDDPRGLYWPRAILPYIGGEKAVMLCPASPGGTGGPDWCDDDGTYAPCNWRYLHSVGQRAEWGTGAMSRLAGTSPLLVCNWHRRLQRWHRDNLRLQVVGYHDGSVRLVRPGATTLHAVYER